MLFALNKYLFAYTVKSSGETFTSQETDILFITIFCF